MVKSLEATAQIASRFEPILRKGQLNILSMVFGNVEVEQTKVFYDALREFASRSEVLSSSNYTQGVLNRLGGRTHAYLSDDYYAQQAAAAVMADYAYKEVNLDQEKALGGVCLAAVKELFHFLRDPASQTGYGDIKVAPWKAADTYGGADEVFRIAGRLDAAFMEFLSGGEISGAEVAGEKLLPYIELMLKLSVYDVDFGERFGWGGQEWFFNTCYGGFEDNMRMAREDADRVFEHIEPFFESRAEFDKYWVVMVLKRAARISRAMVELTTNDRENMDRMNVLAGLLGQISPYVDVLIQGDGFGEWGGHEFVKRYVSDQEFRDAWAARTIG